MAQVSAVCGQRIEVAKERISQPTIPGKGGDLNFDTLLLFAVVVDRIFAIKRQAFGDERTTDGLILIPAYNITR